MFPLGCFGAIHIWLEGVIYSIPYRTALKFNGHKENAETHVERMFCSDLEKGSKMLCFSTTVQQSITMHHYGPQSNVDMLTLPIAHAQLPVFGQCTTVGPNGSVGHYGKIDQVPKTSQHSLSKASRVLFCQPPSGPSNTISRPTCLFLGSMPLRTNVLSIQSSAEWSQQSSCKGTFFWCKVKATKDYFDHPTRISL